LNLKKWSYPLEDFLNYLEGKLKTAFLKRLGVLLIVVDKNKKNISSEEVKRKITKKARGITIIQLSPEDKNYDKFCLLITGIKKAKDENGIDFVTIYETYNQQLNRTVRRFSIFVSRDRESKDKHQYPYKVATAVYLFNELLQEKLKEVSDLKKLDEKIIEILGNRIKIEEELDNCKIIPDILYKDKNIAIEIETLIGTVEPMKKIDETVLKYKDCDQISEIWIVLRPVSAFIHYRELLRREKVLERMVNIKIKFMVLILEGNRWKLMDLREWRKLGSWSKSGRIPSDKR
jgi:hypothetical protein